MDGLSDKHFGLQFNAIADAVGYSAATKICEELGGQDYVYVPKNPKAEHKFRDIVGDEKFTKLVKAFGGDRINIPQPPKVTKKSAIIDDLLSRKLSNAAIATRHGVVTRYVRRIRSELGEGGLAVPASNLPTPPIPHEKVFEFLGWPQGSAARVAACAREPGTTEAAIASGAGEQLIKEVRAMLRWVYGIGQGTKAAFKMIPSDRRHDPKAFLADILKVIYEHQPEAIGQARGDNGQD